MAMFWVHWSQARRSLDQNKKLPQREEPLPMEQAREAPICLLHTRIQKDGNCSWNKRSQNLEGIYKEISYIYLKTQKVLY
jgi:hypothetical protein